MTDESTIKTRYTKLKEVLKTGLEKYDENDDKVLSAKEAQKTIKEKFPLLIINPEDCFFSKDDLKDQKVYRKYLAIIETDSSINDKTKNNLTDLLDAYKSGELNFDERKVEVKAPTTPRIPIGSYKALPKLTKVDNDDYTLSTFFDEKEYLPDKGVNYKPQAGSPGETIFTGSYEDKKKQRFSIYLGMDGNLYIIQKKDSKYSLLSIPWERAKASLKIALAEKIKGKITSPKVQIILYGDADYRNLRFQTNWSNEKAVKEFKALQEAGGVIYFHMAGSKNDWSDDGVTITLDDKKEDFAQLVYESIIQGKDLKTVCNDIKATFGDTPKYGEGETIKKAVEASKNPIQTVQATTTLTEITQADFKKIIPQVFAAIGENDVLKAADLVYDTKDKLKKKEIKEAINKKIKELKDVEGFKDSGNENSKLAVALQMLLDKLDSVAPGDDDAEVNKADVRTKISQKKAEFTVAAPLVTDGDKNAFEISLGKYSQIPAKDKKATVQLVYYQGSFHILFGADVDNKKHFFIFSIPKGGMKKVFQEKKWKEPGNWDILTKEDMKNISEQVFKNFTFLSHPLHASKVKEFGLVEATSIDGFTIATRKNDTKQLYPTDDVSKDVSLDTFDNYLNSLGPIYLKKDGKSIFLNEDNVTKDSFVMVQPKESVKLLQVFSAEDSKPIADLPDIDETFTVMAGDKNKEISIRGEINKQFKDIHIIWDTNSRTGTVNIKNGMVTTEKVGALTANFKFETTRKIKINGKDQFISVYSRNAKYSNENTGLQKVEFMFIIWDSKTKANDMTIEIVKADDLYSRLSNLGYLDEKGSNKPFTLNPPNDYVETAKDVNFDRVIETFLLLKDDKALKVKSYNLKDYIKDLAQIKRFTD